MDVHLTLRRPGPLTAWPKQSLRPPYFFTNPRRFIYVVVASIDVASVIIADAFQRAKADGFHTGRQSFN